jgi:hypothetical protein
MYSIFTQHYFDNCAPNDPYCKYIITDQYYACNFLIENEGGQMFYHGIHNEELIDIEVTSDGIQKEKYLKDPEYHIKGMYVIMDLTEEEQDYNHNICLIDDIIKIHKYLSEPYNFYRRMIIYIVTNEFDTTFCPMWVLSDEF